MPVVQALPNQGYVSIASKGTIRRKVERTMADVTDLAAKIEERRRMIDQVDQALAEMRRAAAAGTRGRRGRAKKQKRGPRQLRLPLPLGNDEYR
jgi:t-SNARE complex subunit (syntaxin)